MAKKMVIFAINNINTLKEIIKPIFNKYPLRKFKYLYFKT
jgi:hypothetical protein